MRFAAIGECMMELSDQRADRWRLGFAGDALNTAWYVRAAARCAGRAAGRVQIVDTTGAGDSFCGGYLAGRLAGLTPKESAAQGHPIAAQVVGRYRALIEIDAVSPPSTVSEPTAS